MCGILGLYCDGGRLHETDLPALRRSLDLMRHRGPDARNLVALTDLGLALGHARLSILDLSSAAHQPMKDEESGNLIVFNGEIYNFPELRQELEAAGFEFRTRSDTEALLLGYRHWGTDVLRHLVGMFAFAIWDAGRRMLFLARDRAGEKPLYYFHHKGRFAFASELQALAGLGGPERAMDPTALSSYLNLQYIPAPFTIWQGHYKLPAASAMLISAGQSPVVWRYWDPIRAPGKAPAIREEDALQQLDDLLTRSVKGQLLSDVPLGAFLSGGIDSSLVVAKMAQLSPGEVRTFTIGFDDPAYDESPYAEAVARHLGTQHVSRTMSQQHLLQQVPLLPARFAEPFGDSSAIPTFLVSQTARQHVTVSLSGDGGDELFGGYATYRSLERYRLMHTLGGPLLRLTPQELRRRIPKLGRLADSAGQSVHDIFKSLVSAFDVSVAERLTGVEPLSPEFDRAFGQSEIGNPRTTARLADLLSYLPDDILVKVDRSAMAVSLESRAPLLDHRIIEFAFGLPDPLVTGKRLLRNLAFRHIPRPLLERPKRGFAVPLATWFRGPLRPLLHDTLTAARLQTCGIDQPEPALSLLQRHQKGENHSMKLWVLLMLALWHEAHVAKE